MDEVNPIYMQAELRSSFRMINCRKLRTFCILAVIFVYFQNSCFAQTGITYDIKKPEKYENRVLGSEKTETTKFKVPRRFIQNTITHYNYYFNANNKINEVLARAKGQNKDDYTQLLPFYNYSLDVTARDKRNLDSIIDKVTTAILIHDLRNDWVDNLYILMGRAYYYKKELDSAYITFQFVNYAFSKDKDGYDVPIGSNANKEEGAPALSVSTNEKRNIVKKTFSMPPSRNESLIWQIRTFIAKGQMNKAAALIEILKHDPQFPDRLKNDLNEMQALWFYRQSVYDSAAIYLEKALGNADGRLEQARWEFLIGQLYERSGKPDNAKFWYEKTIQHTYDPVMDVYARLNAIRQNRGKNAGDNYIKENISALEKMARKEVYASYRDIIYYAAAEMELERKDRVAATAFLIKSTRNTLPNSPQRDKSFLLLGDLSLEDKKYKAAKNYYDSINVSDIGIAERLKQLQERKQGLSKIVEQQNIIHRQDSLQAIAALSENDRDAYIKKLVKAFRRQQGLQEEEQNGGQNFSFGSNNNNAQQDLFGTGANGDWYFYNNSLKAKGYSDFKSRWGNRPNVDNWQVASLVSRQKLSPGNGQGNQLVSQDNPVNAQQAPVNVTAESLLANVPLTPEKMQKSKDSIENALHFLGKALQETIPDYPSAINAYDSLIVRFPSTKYYEETLFNLYFCYKKMGDDVNANRILALLEQKYPNGKYLAVIKNPNAPTPDDIQKSNATRQYEKIYSEFIEGNFDQALADKKTADSLYGEKYWTPQLLYIEAVFFVHQRRDSLAMAELNNVIRKYPGTPISAKAKNMLDVLKKRKELEEYLSNLKIVRSTDSLNAPVATAAPPKEPGQREVKVNRAKTALDSAQAPRQKQGVDSALTAKKLPVIASVFSYVPEKAHSVAILMNKVDPVYVTESRNAFNRYNRENYYSQTFNITNIALNDTFKLVVIDSFENAQLALAYLDKAQKLAPREIIPWLPPAKYSFFIISAANLELLKNNKDVNAYKKFLSAYFPDKF